MTRGRLAPVLLLAGCGSVLEPIDGEAPCREAGLSIADRTWQCTGDMDLANARYEAFIDQVTCRSVDFDTEIGENEAWYDVIQDSPADWFHCSFAIGELSCELVEDYGDDLSLWLTASPACDAVIEAGP